MNTTTNTRYKKFERVAFDYYATPPEAINALLEVEQFEGDVWECACGEGAIAEELKKKGYEVVVTDLIDRGYGQGGVNFLKETKARAKNIITNPPYSLGDVFIRKALYFTRQTGGSVAMLCDLSSLCHPSRHQLFTKCPPSGIYALDRIHCLPNGKQPEFKNYKQRYCWIVWKSGYTGETRFHWLKATS